MKAKPPKEIRERRQSRPSREKNPKKAKMSFWKRVEWTVASGVAIAGLLLTAMQYRARPTASLGTPLDPTNVLTTPIIIANDGLMDLKDMRFDSFVKEFRAGGLYMHDAYGARDLQGVTLTPGEKQEILPYTWLSSVPPQTVNSSVEAVDFAMVVYFRPAYWPLKKRRLFRFGLVRNTDGTKRLRQIAAGDIELKLYKE